jgi:hypothetical protein
MTIVNGASRSGPQQLAVYLMRVGRYDTGEPTQLLEFQSIRAIGVDANNRERTSAQLSEGFRDWQSSVEATQRGRDGLYHCEISPEARYARDLTKKDWLRHADIAGQELGLDGQRRAVVLHAGKDGRPHLHVVWERTDLEKMKVISDANNYHAHERASHRMEKEFGHEFIPGKHAKRDRKRQKEFPRAKLSQAEDQYQKRTGLSKEQRLDEIASLKVASENGPAFKAAVEEAGYVLAQGDRYARTSGERSYVVVDRKGGQSVLTRNLGLKKEELDAFMKGVELDKLPTVQEAKAIQSERRKAVSKGKALAERAAAEQRAPDRVPEPARTPDALKILKENLAAMKAAVDGPQAFKAAIEQAGFILANGDRGYTLVDDKGELHNLARQLKMKVAEVNEYMAPVALASLPTADQAQAMQAVARQSVSKSNAPAEAGKQAEGLGVEASKFAQSPPAEKSPEPVPVAPKASAERRQPEPIDPARKAQITSLRAWSDGAKAFKQALEEAGYTLARGKTGYVLFSQDGTFSLIRHAGLPKSRLHGFMSPIPLDSLPLVKDLIAAQREGRNWTQEARVQELPVAPVLPPLPTTKDLDLGSRMELSALDMAAETLAEAQRQARQNLDPKLEAIERAVAKRHEEETAKMRDRHDFELRGKEVEMDREIVRQLAGYKNIQDQQTEAFVQARKEYRTGIWGILDAINSRWNPTQAAEKTKAREKERQNFYRRLAKERADYEALLQQTKALEIENLIDRQRQQLRDLDTRTAEEKERYIQEHHDAKRIAAEMEQERLQQEELEHNDSLREGPPPPKLGK